MKTPAQQDSQEQVLALVASSDHAYHAVVLAPGEVPEWVHLIPAGEIDTRDGRGAPGGPWKLGDAKKVIDTTLAYHNAQPIPMDFDHQLEHTEKNGAGAPASGWITELEARDDGIWGKVDWTPDGSNAIAQRKYRYLSPVFAYNKRGDVLALLRAGLTNKPNLPALTAINSTTTSEDGMSESLKAALQRLAAIFGLPATADEAAIEAAANSIVESEKIHRGQLVVLRGKVKLGEKATADEIFVAAQATATIDPEKFIPIETHRAIASQLETMQNEQAEVAVNAAMEAGKVSPANKAWALDYAKRDLKGFTKFAGGQPTLVQGGEERRDRAAANSAKLSESEIAICAATGVSEEDFLKTKNARKES